MNTRKDGLLSVKDWTRNEYGRNALIALLGGLVLNMSGYTIGEVFGSILALLGFGLGVIWAYLKISKKEPAYK
ncbi:MAG: hypothetical protein AB203_00430 [Parcubacteria bacterium C7867-008]|nr:MAG: hypothetical protein AB203_00430 [Parcubacteria bacterium C7867-008]